MTAREAMEDALAWGQRYAWRETDITDRWETLREMLLRRGCECDGHGFACLQHFAALCRAHVPPPWPAASFVIGHVDGTPETERHLWVELIEDGEMRWGDPTPGYPAGLHRPGFWARTPEWGFGLNLVDGVPVLPGYPYERAAH